MTTTSQWPVHHVHMHSKPNSVLNGQVQGTLLAFPSLLRLTADMNDNDVRIQQGVVHTINCIKTLRDSTRYTAISPEFVVELEMMAYGMEPTVRTLDTPIGTLMYEEGIRRVVNHLMDSVRG